MLRSPLSWVGGKHRLRERIIGMIPPHKIYVEVFAGAAWVLFGKDPLASKSEVLNDLDGELINFYRVLKHRSAEFTEAASWLLASRELWTRWKALPGVGSEVARAIRFYAVIRLGFGSQRIPTSFGSKNDSRPRTTWADLKKESRAIVGRLRGVWIENLPWEKCLAKFDGNETFFYLDPPYRAYGSKAYKFQFTDAQHAALSASLLGRVRAKWLLSYNDDPFVWDLYHGQPGVAIERVSVPYSIAREGRAKGGELLIRNYRVGHG